MSPITKALLAWFIISDALWAHWLAFLVIAHFDGAINSGVPLTGYLKVIMIFVSGEVILSFVALECRQYFEWYQRLQAERLSAT